MVFLVFENWDNKMVFPKLGTRPFYTVFSSDADFGHENPVEPAVCIILNNFGTRTSNKKNWDYEMRMLKAFIITSCPSYSLIRRNKREIVVSVLKDWATL